MNEPIATPQGLYAQKGYLVFSCAVQRPIGHVFDGRISSNYCSGWLNSYRWIVKAISDLAEYNNEGDALGYARDICPDPYFYRVVALD